MTIALSNAEIEDRFFLFGRMEIQSVLNDLVHRREQVSIHFNGGRDVVLTILLEVRPDVLIFDLGGIESANRALVAATGGVMVAQPDGIRVQFSIGKVQRFRWGESDAFWVPLPERVVRLQRREYFRVMTSQARPQPIGLQLGDGGGLLNVKLRDIGVGGIGAYTSDATRLSVDTPIASLSLYMPDFGDLICPAVVRHVTRDGHERGKTHHRAGLRFLGLSRADEVRIQRYIVHLEQERRRLLAGG